MNAKCSVGTNTCGYQDSCCVVLAEHACLKGEARAWHSVCRWKCVQRNSSSLRCMRSGRKLQLPHAFFAFLEDCGAGL